MSYLDILAVSHGLLGVLVLMGTGGALALLWSPRKSLNPLKFFSSLGTASAFLAALLGDALYIIYRSPENARSILKAGENKWVHSIGMEFKEHVGHFIPVLLLIAAFIVFYYREDAIKNRGLRRTVMAFLVLSLLYTFVEMSWGAFITGVQPVI
jgi:hypothetical protein